MTAAELIRSVRPQARVLLHTASADESKRARARELGLTLLVKGDFDATIAAVTDRLLPSDRPFDLGGTEVRLALSRRAPLPLAWPTVGRRGQFEALGIVDDEVCDWKREAIEGGALLRAKPRGDFRIVELYPASAEATT